MNTRSSLWSIVLAVMCGAHPAIAQPPSEKPATPKAEDVRAEIDDALSRGVILLLGMQEGDDHAEWPYEGVYRVGGKIPIGYRIGGTSITALALLRAPGYHDDEARRDAVARAAAFVIKGIEHPLMNPDYDGGYDVRGWGYTYGALFLLALSEAGETPNDMRDQVKATIEWYTKAIERTEIPTIGGWNYARSPGKDAISRPSPFMTAPTLQAIFEARRQGFAVNEEVVARALKTLEGARTATGSFVYAGAAEGRGANEPVPGSVGRMLASETTLYLAGRSTLANIRGAIDSFITHWEWLDKRRAQNGTHVPPYSIAPYYFYYAHFYAAQAIEMLPEGERAEYRRRLHELIFRNRLEDGAWNDRVFARSANFGTSMVLMALRMPQSPRPAVWAAGTAPAKKD